MGAHYREIDANCNRLKSQHVLAWTWVISPAPDLMALVPEDQRRALVMDVTERIVEAYYEARGYQTPPYAYVLHDRQTKEGEQQLHTHVILPGLAPTVAGWEPLYINKRQGHDDSTTIAHDEFEQAWIGRSARSGAAARNRAQVAHDIPTDADSLDDVVP